MEEWEAKVPLSLGVKVAVTFAVNWRKLFWSCNRYRSVLVAARSKAEVCDRLLLRLWFRIPPGGMDVCLLRVLSGRGLCDELITCPEESYRMWCVLVWSRNLVNKEAMAHWGLSCQKLNKTGRDERNWFNLG